MSIPYTKMHGCHNDYVYIENLKGQHSGLLPSDLSELARRVSNRKTGIGSDGLILVNPPSKPETHATMRMFNADGSEGRMCGNGIRCVAKILHEVLGPKECFLVETLAGTKQCYVVDSSRPDRFMVRVNMGRPSFLPSSIPVLFDDMMVMGEEFDLLDRTFKISCVSMGNPHCVVPIEGLENFDINKYGPAFESHEVFPEKVNTEFVEVRDGKIYQRTWERGSGETQACGTGACAVGVVYMMSGQFRAPVTIHLKGGELMINWDGLHDVWMTGEAVTEGQGTIS